MRGFARHFEYESEYHFIEHEHDIRATTQKTIEDNRSISFFPTDTRGGFPLASRRRNHNWKLPKVVVSSQASVVSFQTSNFQLHTSLPFFLPTDDCPLILLSANCQLPTFFCQLPTFFCPLPTSFCQLTSSIFRQSILLDWSPTIQEPAKTLIMSPSNPTEQEKQWIAAWRSAGPELERIRTEELRALTEEHGTSKATLLGVFERQPLSESSGLLEFQKWMILWRKKLGQVK